MINDQAREAFETAVRTFVADSTDGGLVTDWVLTAAAISPDDAEITAYVTETSHSSVHARLGLARYAALTADRLVPIDEPDDEP